MQTDTITTNCVLTGSDYVCTTQSFFGGGEMFISLCLVIIIILGIISLIRIGIFSVDIHKTEEIRNSEGKKTYKI